MKSIDLSVPLIKQFGPNCGPFSLTQVFWYFNKNISPKKIVREIKRLASGGTCDSFLGLYAIKEGFKSEIIPYNINIFDPTWKDISSLDLIDKLEKRMKFEINKNLRERISGYINFLKRGGKIIFKPLSILTVLSYLKKGIPLISSLSLTALYEESRMVIYKRKNIIKWYHDDVKGESVGHFVVISGYDHKKKLFKIKDSWHEIPYNFSKTGDYVVNIEHFFYSMMMGCLTGGGSFTIVYP